MKPDKTTRSGFYEPTAQDIRRACEQIQATWSPRERRKRAGALRKVKFTIPRVSLSEIIFPDKDEAIDTGSFTEEEKEQ